MEKGKNPGVDGLPKEFYKTYFELLQNDLQPLYNAILLYNEDLLKTMKVAIITLLPKNKETKHLRNWRPISLLYVDYKILKKILATRLKKVLKNTISEEQNCGILNRTIFSNLFEIRELKNYTNNKKRKAFIISIDQEKAFDKVDRNPLFKTMEKLGFSKQFIQFIILLYNDKQALITNNEYVSKPFNIGRGVRQGCPLSLLLYIIYGKLINANIKNNDKIQGLKIPNRKDIKISQFVDDTNFITINKGFIMEIKNFLTKYGKALNKTTIIELANTKIYNLQNKLTNFKIIKNNELFKILGIYFFKDLQFTSKNNWIICVQKTENQINLLSKRKVSLRGKINYTQLICII